MEKTRVKNCGECKNFTWTSLERGEGICTDSITGELKVLSVWGSNCDDFSARIKDTSAIAKDLSEGMARLGKRFNEYKDNVIKPSHYKAGEFDVIAFCQKHNLNFDAGNVIKYVTRAGKKKDNSELQDLNKAMEYLKRRIEFVKEK